MLQNPTDVQRVELFHLLLLWVFSRHWDSRCYIIKGGINLRAWFGSQRYSEDMDLDALVEPHVIEKGVDTVLKGVALQKLLLAQGMSLLRSTKPKMTDTTQRWKFELSAQGMAAPVRTKIEFSHRDQADDDEFAMESVRPDVVAPYGLLPPSAQHYSAQSAVRQKIRALAGRREMQARDIWDLDHLLRTQVQSGPPLGDRTRALLPTAIERAVALPYDAFKGQVVPYLPAELQDLYADPGQWDEMQLRVLARLEALR